MGEKIHTYDSRITFVDGWLTGGTDPADGSVECGDGTAYPLEVTVDQLAEIFYRVRDAWFTSGRMNIDFGSGSEEWLSFYGSPITTQLVNEENSGDNFSFRSYHTDGTLPTHLSSYFGIKYTVRATDYYDVSDNELAMWLPYVSGEAPAFNGSGSNDFKCGFTHYSEYVGITNTPSFYGIYNPYAVSTSYEPANITVEITGKVAFLDDNGSGDPMDSGNKLYLGVELKGGIQSADVFSTDSDYDTISSMMYAGVDMVFKLSNSSPSCPIYHTDNGDSFPAGTNFTLEAKKWWEYADSNGDPAFDSTTGAPINEGV